MKRAYFQSFDIAQKFWFKIPKPRKLLVAKSFRPYKGGWEVRWWDK